MSNLIPFDAGLPAYLKNVDPAALNDDLTSHASQGFPIISIKGKVFAVVRQGERKIIPNPKDPESPATSIDMVIVKANKGTSKVFYANGYQEGGDNVKPDCFSNDGIRPDASVDKPVCKSCATCPNNQWGSKISDAGKKVKACQDSVRIAIATPDQLNDPYMLRVPPASIRALGEYGTMLKKRGVSYQMVVTKIGFDMQAPTPILTFKPVGFLPEQGYRAVQDAANSEVVQNILGAAFDTVADEGDAPDTAAAVVNKVKNTVARVPVPAAATKDKTVTEAEVIAAVEQAVEPAKAAPKTVDSIDDIDLDGLSFD